MNVIHVSYNEYVIMVTMVIGDDDGSYDGDARDDDGDDLDDDE